MWDSDDSDEDPYRREYEERSRPTYMRREPREMYCRRIPHMPKVSKERLERIKKEGWKKYEVGPEYGYRGSEEDEYDHQLQGRESPLLCTDFPKRDRHGREVMCIKDLVDSPGRYRRPSRCVLFIRGPLNSGKSFLSKIILEREKRYGDTRAMIINGINPDRSRSSKESSEDVKDGPNLLFKQYYEAAIAKVHFLIIEVKSNRRDVMENLKQLSEKYGYEMFVININLKPESEIFKQRLKEIRIYAYEKLNRAYMHTMEYHELPSYIQEVNPIALVPNNLKVVFHMRHLDDYIKLPNFTQTEFCADDFSAIEDMSYEISLMKDIFKVFPSDLYYSNKFESQAIDKVIDLIADKKQAPYTSVVDVHLSKFPSFEPKSVIDYDHKPLKYNDWGMLEVNPMLFIDHKHFHNQYLANAVDDIQMDSILSSAKRYKRERKWVFYKKFEKRSGIIVSEYPNNWERVGPAPKPAQGKRKKVKNAKILKVIALKGVQKGVRKLKIEDQFFDAKTHQDDSTPMEYEDAIEMPYYIDEILRKTSVDRRAYADLSKPALEYIKSIYKRLDYFAEMSTIMHLVAQVDNFKIKFKMLDEESYCYSVTDGLVEMSLNDLTESEILKALGHQFMHCAVHWTYKNSARPYFEKDEDRKEELERIFIELDICENENNKEFKEVLDKYRESSWHTEIAGIFAEYIVDRKVSEMRKVKNLWEFYRRMMDDIQAFDRRFRSGSKLGVL